MAGKRVGGVVLGVVLAALGAGSAAAQTKVTTGYGPANAWIPAVVAKDQGIAVSMRRYH